MDDPHDPWFSPEPRTGWTVLQGFYKKWLPPLVLLALTVWMPLAAKRAWYPPIGVYIAIVAVGAIVVTIWPPESKWRKAAWLAIFFWLGGFEIHNLYRDRDEHDAREREAREHEAKAFSKIGEGIQNSIMQAQTDFNATMERLEGVRSKEETNLAETTGGNSFPYIIMAGFSQNELIAQLGVCGTHPLHQVHVTIVDEDAIGAAFKTPGGASASDLNSARHNVPVIDFLSIASFLNVVATYPMKIGVDHWSFNASFVARNGGFEELMRVRRITQGLTTAVIVSASYFD